MQEFVTSTSCRSKRFFCSPKHPDWVPGVYSPWVKWSGNEDVPLSITEVRNEWSYISTPCMPSCQAQGQHYLFIILDALLSLMFK
jgi:hypothetical protein